VRSYETEVMRSVREEIVNLILRSRARHGVSKDDRTAGTSRHPSRRARKRALLRMRLAIDPVTHTSGACFHLSAMLVALAALFLATTAYAQPQRDPGEIHGLKLGLKADEMSTDTFGDLACGSNGGPPRQAIDDWSDFRKCRSEPSGLHEVNARFDDQQEYVGRAIDDPMYAQGRLGTRVAGHPVILSVLFDKEGILRGIRMVSDPRGSIMERRMAHMLRLAIINRYDPDGWNCTDLPPAAGETAVGGGVFIKQRCEKRTAERDLFVEARFLRKPGQSDINPTTGETTTGQFESWTRFELMDPNYKKP
jgi:hypothetical protein